MAPTKTFVYAITRRDFDHYQDKKGALTVFEIHASLESANAAAKAHLVKESAKAPGHAKTEINEKETKDGGYEGNCRTWQDKRNNFTVLVKRFELKGAAPDAGTKDATSSIPSTAKKASKPVNAADTTAASSSKTEILQGEKNSLKDLKLLFTGTFNTMDRKTCEATAKTHGAVLMGPTKLADCDMIVLGTRAGQKKLDEIEEKSLKTITEAEFIEMLGEPPSKKRKA